MYQHSGKNGEINIKLHPKFIGCNTDVKKKSNGPENVSLNRNYKSVNNINKKKPLKNMFYL